MRFDDRFLEEVRAVTDIVEVISPYVKLKKKGRNHFGLCPFHNEKTPSFSVNRERGIYHCFGCGAGGNAITFLIEHGGMTFPQSVEELARRGGIPIPERRDDPKERTRDRLFDALESAAAFYQQQLREEAGGRAVDYLKGRGITGETARDYRLGCAPDAWDALLNHLTGRGFTSEELGRAGLIKKRESGDGYYDTFRDRLIFPFTDRQGRVVGFGGRILGEEGPGAPKYLNSPDTPLFQKGRVLYGLSQALPTLFKQEHVLLVEGQFDVLTLHQAGIGGAVAASGTAFTSEQARLLKRLVERVYLLFDADRAGLKAGYRSYEELVREGLDVVFVAMPAGEDPDTMVRSEGRDAFTDRLDSAEGLVPFFVAHLDPPMADRETSGRAAAARELIDLLRHDSDGLRRELSLQEAAVAVGLDQNTLRREMEALQQERGRFETPPEPTIPRRRERPGRLESDLFRLLMQDEGFRATAFERLGTEDFTDDRLQELVGLAARQQEDQGAVDVDQMLERCSPASRDLLAELLSEEVSEGPAEGLGDELLQGLESRRRKLRRRRLKESMEQARLAGDEDTLARLLREYQEMHP